MDIILGRAGEVRTFLQHQASLTSLILQVPQSRQASGIFENIKEKAKHGFSATKRNFL